MINRKYSFFIIITTLLLWALIFFVIPFKTETVFLGKTMGTTYEVKITQNLSNYNQNIITQDIDSILNSINQSMSTYIPNSEISLINKDEVVFKSFIVSNSFKYVLNKSLEYYNLTEGAFDVTIKPLLKLWGFKGVSVDKEPEVSAINDIIEYVGSNKIKFKGNQLTKKHPKLQLDFGAIAKGYAVDQISNYLIESGYKSHYVEIGGEIICKGKKWNIQIAYPEFLSNKGYKIVELNNHAIATSGTYNQFIEIDDFEYSHIFDPRLGRPVQNTVVSVTVISNKSIDSDALATSLKVLGKEKGVELINSISNVECMFILKENNVLKDYYSNNFLSFILD
ncbi:MAG: hypothetical protein CMG21_01530 [Candidatus Marinimicrobia bacterium]|nr:hypothetical protein [Candidatus Neomarinimicrobiota bacterium]